MKSNPFPARTLLTQAGLSRSHWGKRIIAAEKRGRFTKLDKDDASWWTTCACGKRDRRILRDLVFAPQDGSLRSCGAWFSSHVENNRFEEAAETLISIEARAREVLAGIKAEGKSRTRKVQA